MLLSALKAITCVHLLKGNTSARGGVNCGLKMRIFNSETGLPFNYNKNIIFEDCMSKT